MITVIDSHGKTPGPSIIAIFGNYIVTVKVNINVPWTPPHPHFITERPTTPRVSLLGSMIGEKRREMGLDIKAFCES